MSATRTAGRGSAAKPQTEPYLQAEKRDLEHVNTATLQFFFRMTRTALQDFDSLVNGQRYPHKRLVDQPKHVQRWASESKLADRALRLLANELMRREHVRGQCMFCGCEELAACAVNTADGFQPCGWIDFHCIACDDWRCLAEYGRYKRTPDHAKGKVVSR